MTDTLRLAGDDTKFVKRQEIKTLQPNSRIEDIFAIKSINQPRSYKNKPGLFFTLEVSDRSGSISVKYWGSPDEQQTIDLYGTLIVGQVVYVVGMVTMAYQSNNMEISVNSGSEGCIRQLVASEYECDSFVPLTERDMAEMLEELGGYTGSIKDEPLRSLVKSFFEDNEFMTEFTKAPAAKVFHGCVVGGLIEHTLQVTKTCNVLSRMYPFLNRDLLVAGALLHDIGKIYEYDVGAAITMTNNAILRGHIVTGAEMVSKKCDELTIPDPTKIKIVHMVLASHGRPEYGSPTYPAIPEALMLHYADDMDAKMEQFQRAIEKANPNMAFIKDDILGRYVFLK